MSDGGPAQPVTPVTTGFISAAPALRVAVVSDGRPTLAGPSMPVYVVTDNRPTQGNVPVPVVLATGQQSGNVMAGPAIPIVVVSGSLSPGTPPVNTVLPAISGTVNIGYTLTSSTGTWTGTAPIAYTYVWKRAGVAIGGATNSTYVLTETDSGQAITVTVTATNVAGNASATSASVTPPSFLLLDRFTTSRAAGSVNGTAMEPGGTLARNRTVIDGSSIAPIANAEWEIGVGGGANNPNYTMSGAGIARAAGLLMVGKSNTGNGCAFLIGWGTAPTLYTHRLNWNNGNLRIGNGGFANIAVLLANSPYWFFVVLRTTGVFMFVWGADFSYPQLLFVERVGTSTPLFPAWSMSTVNGGGMVLDDMEIPADALVPAAVTSDDFTRANGAPGNTNVYDGGTALAWGDKLGTAAIIGNALGWSALSSGEGLVAVDGGKADVVIIASLTRSAGVIGLVTRWVDANNYVRIIHDGANAKIIKRVAGVETTAATAAIAFSAGADLLVAWDRTNIRAWYNGTAISGSATAISDAGVQNGTIIGLYSSDTGNTADNFAVWARGNGNEHSQYRTYGVLKQAQNLIIFEGDSLTVGTTGVTNSYPYVAITSLGRASYDYYNVAVTGQTVVQMLADASYQYYPIIGAHAKDICVTWGGTNDISAGDSATTVYNNIVALCTAQRAAGYKVVVCTIIARGTFGAGQNTIKATVNANIVANWATFADALCNLAADARLSNSSDATYYNADTVHLTTTGYAVVSALVVPVVQALP